MFEGITRQKVVAMTEQELRWFDNLKKAFRDSDAAYSPGTPEDGCLEELFKAIDTAKTLRRSLRGEDFSTNQNKAKFLEFLRADMPDPKQGDRITLVDARNQQSKQYSFSEIVYAIRCMVHENENLNVIEGPDYHILIDWNIREPHVFGFVSDGRIRCNGHLFRERLRQTLAKFITGLEMMAEIGKGGSRGISINPPLGSIRPKGSDRT